MWCLQDPRMREHSWCHQQRLEESSGCSRQHEARPKSACPAFQESGTQMYTEKVMCLRTNSLSLYGLYGLKPENSTAKLPSYLTWRLFPYVSIIPQHRYDRFHPALQFLAASKYFSLFQYSRGAFTALSTSVFLNLEPKILSEPVSSYHICIYILYILYNIYIII